MHQFYAVPLEEEGRDLLRTACCRTLNKAEVLARLSCYQAYWEKPGVHQQSKHSHQQSNVYFKIPWIYSARLGLCLALSSTLVCAEKVWMAAGNLVANCAFEGLFPWFYFAHLQMLCCWFWQRHFRNRSVINLMCALPLCLTYCHYILSCYTPTHDI